MRDVDTIDWAAATLLVLAALSFIGAQLRTRRDRLTTDALAAQAAELAAVHGANDRLDVTIRDLQQQLELSRRSCAESVSELQGRVRELETANVALERLVSLQSTPPAGLIEALDRVVVDRVDVRLHTIEQGMARLLTKGGTA